MAERPSKKGTAKAPARPKPAPRTKGTPAKPPAPRKAAAPAKPKATRTARAKATATPSTAPTQARRPATPPASNGWEPAGAWAPPADDGRWSPAPRGHAVAPVATNEPQWLPASAPPPAYRPATAVRPFDPATGAWLPAPALAPASVQAEEAVDVSAVTPKVRAILMHVLLGIDLAFLGLNFLLQVGVGIILLWFPDTSIGERMQEFVGGEQTPADLITNALISFLMIGLVPFLWVLGTRVAPWRGTVAFLRLRVGWKDWVRGVVLVPIMIAAVYALVVAYTCAVEGCGALDDPPEQDSAMAEMLENLTWPVVIVVALAAGIGEEILFRGVLQRWIGVWGQGVAFGLAHAVNAYPPQVLFAFGLGVAFGYLYKRGWSLVSLMVAHFLYDFVLLAMAMLYPDLG